MEPPLAGRFLEDRKRLARLSEGNLRRVGTSSRYSGAAQPRYTPSWPMNRDRAYTLTLTIPKATGVGFIYLCPVPSGCFKVPVIFDEICEGVSEADLGYPPFWSEADCQPLGNHGGCGQSS